MPGDPHSGLEGSRTLLVILLNQVSRKVSKVGG